MTGKIYIYILIRLSLSLCYTDYFGAKMDGNTEDFLQARTDVDLATDNAVNELKRLLSIASAAKTQPTSASTDKKASSSMMTNLQSIAKGMQGA